ncbi:MAG: MarC family protein [Desulfovibrionaceae bacterium]|nr:MarC family protein [Desulfovibrionaceae bacterium]
MKAFWVCFVPLFVAVDPIGIMPVFLGLTRGLDQAAFRRAVYASVATAWAAAVVFLAVGPELLGFIGIRVQDIMVAGGALLFVIALRDLVGSEPAPAGAGVERPGAVPLGVPLIAGPGLLTAVILLRGGHGFWTPALALSAVMLTTCATLVFSALLLRLLGNSGARVLSKIASLVLAAFAVMLVRRGLAGFLS